MYFVIIPHLPSETSNKSVIIVFFVEFIDQLIDYPINRASLSENPITQVFLLDHGKVIIMDDKFCICLRFSSFDMQSKQELRSRFQ